MIGLGALFVLALAGGGGRASVPAALPACVHVEAVSRYVPYGYNHVVILKNGCSKPARCAVSSDVNPEVQTVDVPSNTTTEVTTFIGSPQSTFTPRVSCTVR